MTYLRLEEFESAPMSKVVTANTLKTGTVVFLAKDWTWVHDIADAKVFEDAAAAVEGLGAAMADVDKAIIVDPFVADTGPEANGRPAMTLRDSIRAYGPTIKYLPTDTVA